jgi:hypothetical protein
VHERRFEEVVVHFVVVFYGADDLGVDVSAVVEGLEVAEDAAVGVLDELGLVARGVVEEVRVYVFLDFDAAGAVVELVCDVRCLCGDVADLADEGELFGYVSWDGTK